MAGSPSMVTWNGPMPKLPYGLGLTIKASVRESLNSRPHTTACQNRARSVTVETSPPPP